MTRNELEEFLDRNVDDGWISSTTALAASLAFEEVSRRGDLPDCWKLSTGPWGEVVFIWRNDNLRFDLEVLEDGPVVFAAKNMETREEYGGSFVLGDESHERLSNIRGLILGAA